MARREGKRGRISIFKGREAKLNRAIFHILALKGPLAIYDICKEVRKLKRLRRTKYAVVNRRVRTLVGSRYLEKIGTRKTKAGFRVSLYQLTLRGYVSLLIDQVNLDSFIEKSEDEALIMALASFIQECSKL